MMVIQSIFLNLEWEIAKSLKRVGNANGPETQVITVSSDRKNHGAVAGGSSNCATLPI